jgi:hypothetical protein
MMGIHNRRSCFDRRHQIFHVIAAIAAAALLTSCVGQFRQSESSETADAYSNWLQQNPRSIIISSSIKPVTARYKTIVRTEQETAGYSYGDSRSGTGWKCGPDLGCVVALAIVLPAVLIVKAATSGKRTEVIETEEELDTSQFKKPVKAISAAVKDLNLMRSVASKVAALGRKKTHHKFKVSDTPPSEKLNYPTSSSQGRLELTFEQLQLISKKNKSRQFRLQIEIASKTKLKFAGVSCRFDGGPNSYESDTRKIDEWGANNARMFRDEIAKALDSISKQIIRSVFLDSGSLESNQCLVRVAFLKRAKKGEPLAQYIHGRDSPDLREQQKWFCLAANNGNGAALYGLARLYQRELPAKERDPVKAYQYFLLGKKVMPASADQLAPGLRESAKKMSRSQLARAKHLAANWEPSPDSCPN